MNLAPLHLVFPSSSSTSPAPYAEPEPAWISERHVALLATPATADELRRANALLTAEAEHSAALAEHEAAAERLERAQAGHKRARAAAAARDRAAVAPDK